MPNTIFESMLSRYPIATKDDLTNATHETSIYKTEKNLIYLMKINFLLFLCVLREKGILL